MSLAPALLAGGIVHRTQLVPCPSSGNGTAAPPTARFVMSPPSPMAPVITFVMRTVLPPTYGPRRGKMSKMGSISPSNAIMQLL